MTTVRMMRCHTAHHLGDEYVPAGKEVPEGDPRVGAGTFWTMFEVEVAAPPKATRTRKSAK